MLSLVGDRVATVGGRAKYKPAPEAERDHRGEIRCFSRDERSGHLGQLPLSRYAIEESAGRRLLRFPASGFYVVSLRDPDGGASVDLAFAIRPKSMGFAANGAFSARMASVFPFLERSSRPELALSDLDAAKPAAPRSL